MEIKQKALFAFIFILLTAGFSNGQWVSQNSGTNKNLNSVSFVDSLQGWIVGDSGTILHTSDGGNTWSGQNAGVIANLLGVSFCDAQNGWATGDGGSDWQKIYHDTSQYVRNYKVQCLSPSSVFVLRDEFWGDYWDDERLWRTLDSGRTWEDITPERGLNYELLDMQFFDSSHGWVCGISGVRTFTATWGDSWAWSDNTFNLSTSSMLRRVVFDDTFHGWTTGGDSVFASSDGGHSWSTVGPLQFNITDLYKHGTIGYASCGGNEIKKTTDGGLTWFVQYLPTSDNVSDIEFFTPGIGWGVGSKGSICHTTNGGVTSMNKTSDRQPTEFRLDQNYPNPFNPSTVISYQIAAVSQVTLKVYNVLGEEVAALVNETRGPGEYSVKFDGSKLPSGVYFCRVNAGSFSAVKKLILMK